MVDNSLPKEIILARSSDFGVIFKNGICLKNEFFAFYFVKSDDLKVGFAAKSSGNTKPEKNKLKRIARELWRVSFRKFNLFAHIVIVINSKVLKIDHNKRLAAFQHLLGIVKETLAAGAPAELNKID